MQALAAVVEREFVLSELLVLFHALAGDDQDSVRLLAIENCTAFAKVLNVSDNNKHILPLVKTCAADKSWRVRNNVAKEFFAVCCVSISIGTLVHMPHSKARHAVK